MYIPAGGGYRDRAKKEQLLEELLKRPFELDGFIAFAANFSCDHSLLTLNYSVEVCRKRYAEHIDSSRLIESFKGSDGSKVAFIAVKLGSSQNTGQSGIMQRCFLSRFLAGTGMDAVIAAFYCEGSPVWRLSFAGNAAGFAAKGIRLDFAPVRRCSFLAGESIPYPISQKRLLQLFRHDSTNPSLQDIWQVFSQAAVNREFIRECREKAPIENSIPQMLNKYGFSSKEGVPYDGVAAIDGSTLGALFENLLEEKARKRSGTFYTPPEIVQYMCIESISNCLANKTGVPLEDLRIFLQHGEWLTDEDKLPDRVVGKLDGIDDALADLKVLDPASGSGAFPVCMLNEIVKARMNIKEYRKREISSGNSLMKSHRKKDRSPSNLKYDTIRNCIYAADIDETAISLTKMRLWLSLVSDFDSTDGFGKSGLPSLADFECNTFCGDSLLNGSKWPVKFDAVIGNPPYISAVEAAKTNSSMRNTVRMKYPLLKGAFDIYTAFLLDGIERTNEEGVYCWIVPNKLLVSDYAEPILNFLKQHGLYRTISISGINAFFGTGIYPIIISGNKKSTGYEEFTADSVEDLINGDFKPRIGLKTYKTFADYGIRFASGATGFQAKLLSDCITEHETGDSIPFIVSGSVDKYSVDCHNVRYMGKTYSRAYISKGPGISDKKWDFWCSGKIIIAGLTKVIEAYCFEGPLALGVGTYAICGFAGFDPMFLLGLLNSKFLSWYLNIRFNEKHLAGGYLAINKSTLEQLPFVDADENIRSGIAEIAGHIQELKAARNQGLAAARNQGPKAARNQGPKATHNQGLAVVCNQGSISGEVYNDEAVKVYMDKIDKLVYRLYALNDSEIKGVENYFKLQDHS